MHLHDGLLPLNNLALYLVARMIVAILRISLVTDVVVEINRRLSELLIGNLIRGRRYQCGGLVRAEWSTLEVKGQNVVSGSTASRTSRR